MKYSTALQSAALCAALITSPAFAQLTFAGGSLRLLESEDSVRPFDLLGVSFKELPGSTSALTIIPLPVDDWGPNVNLNTVSQPLTSESHSGSTLNSVQAGTAGYALIRGSYIVKVTNLDFDIAHTTLYADIYTKQGTYLHQTFLVPDKGMNMEVLGTPGLISATIGADGYQHASGVITNLVLDGIYPYQATTALGIIESGLGVSGVAQSLLSQVPFATVDMDARFAVPEPSTYALMVCGIACLALVARRKST